MIIIERALAPRSVMNDRRVLIQKKQGPVSI